MQAVNDDIASFEDLWIGKESRVKIYDLPKVVREKLLENRPRSDSEFKEIYNRICKKLGLDEEGISNDEFKLRDYQIDAREKWIQNNYRGIFAMATGTGKTFTAFGCISRFQKSQKQTVTIIACPQTHLVDQWKREAKTYNNSIPEDERFSLEREVTC